MGRDGREACEGNTILYEGCEARMKVWEIYSEWFKVDQVVRQSCTLLPWLLNGIVDTL